MKYPPMPAANAPSEVWYPAMRARHRAIAHEIAQHMRLGLQGCDLDWWRDRLAHERKCHTALIRYQAMFSKPLP